MSSSRAALLTVLGLASLSRSDAAWFKGEKVVPANSAVFVAKFCFDFDVNANNTGKVDFLLKDLRPRSDGRLKVLLLDDQRDSYPSTNSRWPNTHCDDPRLSTIAKAQLDVVADHLVRSNELRTYIIERLRPRYWFVAVLDCSGVDRTIEYELHMQNIEQGWMREISMDRCGLHELATFLAVYLLTAILQVHAIFLQSSAKTKHPLRLLLTFGICAALWAMGFYTMDMIWYAMSGEDTFMLYLASKLFKVWSKFTLLLICLLLSKGRCISHDLQMRDIVQGAAITFPFLLMGLALELWGEYDESRTYTTNFVYDTWVGAVLFMADLVLFGYYVKNLFRTYSEEGAEDKKAFYRTWGPVYSSAFLSIPAAVILAHVCAAHKRVAIMFIFNNAIHSVLLALLVAGLWPERTQQVFNIDSKTVGACTFGNSMMGEEMKGTGEDYLRFSGTDEDQMLRGNI